MYLSYTCSATSNNFVVLNDRQHLLDCGVQPFGSHAVDPRNEDGQSMINAAVQASSSASSKFNGKEVLQNVGVKRPTASRRQVAKQEKKVKTTGDNPMVHKN